jgi:hypothetical protein
MRNSFLPFVLMILVTAGVIVLLPRGNGQGSAGPEVNPGIFRFPAKAMHRVTSMPLVAENQVESSARAGIAFNPRSVVVVSAEDRGPLTAALMLGLAEGITSRGGIAVLDPLKSPESDSSALLPLGASAVLRVATVSGIPPAVAGGAIVASMRCRFTKVRIPAAHPAARLQRDGVERALELTVAHHSHGQNGGWPSWYAGFGRDVGEAMLRALSEGADALPADLEQPDWGSPLPTPPQCDPLRWSAAFQSELVRGWLGRITAKQSISRAGAAEPSLDTLQRKLERGGWTAQESVDGGLRLWSRDNQGVPWLLSLHEDASGFDVVAWEERAHPAEVFTEWIDEARSGVATRPRPEAMKRTTEQVREDARLRLRRHLECAAVPADLREQARRMLAEPVTAVEPVRQ